MRGSRKGLLKGLLASAAIAASTAGVAGCSLPEVLPLAGGTSPGPSPYGPWYEQHWATNSVLLAATDQPDDGSLGDDTLDEDIKAFEEGTLDDTTIEVTPGEVPPQVPIDDQLGTKPEANAGSGSADFDASTPYQFPSEQFAPAPAPVRAPAPAAVEPAPAPKAGETPAPVDGPIRY
jgi:hypothetical protein